MTIGHKAVYAMALLVAAAGAPWALADEAMNGMEMPAGHHHMHMAAIPPTTARTIAHYTVPAIRLVREDGRQVSLPDELNDGKPVVLAFIYTSCTEICPVTSAALARLQARLGSDRDRVHLVSISIDPEADTPARLASYAKKYGAGPEWHHYTGTLEASIAAQKAFDAYRGDKMNHTPVMFLRAAPDKPWIRLDGFATADMMIEELRPMLAAR